MDAESHSTRYASTSACAMCMRAQAPSTHVALQLPIIKGVAEAFTSVTTKWGGAEAPSSPLDPPLQCKCVYVCVCVSVHCVTVCMCDSVHMCESACHCVTVCMCNMYESEFRTIQYT